MGGNVANLFAKATMHKIANSAYAFQCCIAHCIYEANLLCVEYFK